MAGDPADDPVVGQPELGHHVERDQVADQLVGLFGELVGKVGGRGRIVDQGGGGHLELEDQQRQGDGHNVVGQGEQARHAGQVIAPAGGAQIGRHRHDGPPDYMLRDR